jgi:hypothetical protein
MCRKPNVANKAYEKAEHVSTFISMIPVLRNKHSTGTNRMSPKYRISISKNATKDKLPTIQNTVARIEHTGKGFIL